STNVTRVIVPIPAMLHQYLLLIAVVNPSSLAVLSIIFLFFFLNNTATTEIYTLSLHDALPISMHEGALISCDAGIHPGWPNNDRDRKSTRLNSSHGSISYAVFCLKKKKKIHIRVREANSIVNDDSKDKEEYARMNHYRSYMSDH